MARVGTTVQRQLLFSGLCALAITNEANAKSEVETHGRLMSDFWATASDVDGVDYASGSEVRVAVVGIEGRLNPLISFRMEADLATETPTLRDAWLQFGATDRTVVTLGNFKPLFSLEQLSGLPRGVFLEPALPNAFALNESLGVEVEWHRANGYAGVGFFGEPPGETLPGDEGYGIAARIAFRPLASANRFVHAGVSGYHKFLSAEADGLFRVRQRPEARIIGTRLADTGPASATSTEALGLELAATFGRFSAQAEYVRNHVEFAGGRASFDGAYLSGSWLLTGESRPYRASNATLGRVKPKRAFGEGGRGALEAALRFSTLDLNDAGVFGGEEANATLGLNWYFAERARLMLNYVRFRVRDSLAVRPLGSPAHRGGALGMRAHVDW